LKEPFYTFVKQKCIAVTFSFLLLIQQQSVLRSATKNGPIGASPGKSIDKNLDKNNKKNQKGHETVQNLE